MNNYAWKAVSAEVTGLGHIKFSEPCQDRALHFRHDGVVGAIVCDGAGSCQYSEFGAKAISTAFAQVTAIQFEQWFEAPETELEIESFLEQVLTVEMAKIEGSKRIDFSCTLLVVLVLGDRYLVAHVGDGVICQRKQDGISVLSHPENGRYSNETYFVSMLPLGNHLRLEKGVLQEPTDFMLMSDGTAISFYNSVEKTMDIDNTNMVFNHLAENGEDIMQGEIVSFLEMVRQNTDDDCSLALLVSNEPLSFASVVSIEEAVEELDEDDNYYDEDDDDLGFDLDDEDEEEQQEQQEEELEIDSDEVLFDREEDLDDDDSYEESPFDFDDEEEEFYIDEDLPELCIESDFIEEESEQAVLIEQRASAGKVMPRMNRLQRRYQLRKVGKFDELRADKLAIRQIHFRSRRHQVVKRHNFNR